MTVTVNAIMPVRGRVVQTTSTISRLLATAGPESGRGRNWQLTVVVDHDPALLLALQREGYPPHVVITEARERGYWHALVQGGLLMRSTHVLNLASDLIPGANWLDRLRDTYRARFDNGPGIMGANGDSHGWGHSCHFMIDRNLLAGFGGWPTWYVHNFGDTELCERAQALQSYDKAPWAILFHDHPWTSDAPDDPVYAEGRLAFNQDRELFIKRKAGGWTH